MRISNTTYLDYQASTPVDPRVMGAMEPYFRVNAANPHSVDHAAGWAAQRAIDDSALAIARLIGADADEIVFASGATEANNLAILGLAARAPQSRRRILVSAIEHKCVLASARAAASRYELELETIPAKSNGIIDTEWLEAQLREDVLCVAVIAVNNEIGTIQPLAQVGQLCAEVGAVFHCDAVQAPLAMRLDVHELKIGSLSLSAHKVYGPKGIGVAFLRRDIQDRVEPLIYGGGQQRNLRSGTLPTPLCVGFGAAVSILENIDWTAEYARVRTLRDKFEKRLCEFGNFVQVNAASAARHPGNLNIRFEGYTAKDILAAVQPNLAASTGSACTSGIPEPSHVLRAIGLTEAQVESSIRFSLGRFSVQEDIEIAVDLIRDALSRVAAAA
jgi:cysteine desulfurase